MRCATVDKIEDARSPKFNKAQQLATSCPHLIETEATENRHFCARPETALGTGALPLSASLDSITWKSGLLNSVDPLGNRIYNFDYICPSERTVRVTFPLIPHDFFRHIIESAPANRAGVRRWLFL